MTLQKVLAERDSQYGSFKCFADVYSNLRNQLEQFKNYKNLTNGNRVAIEMILFKCSRLLNGNKDHKDTWIDIAGYASLIEKQGIDFGFFDGSFEYTNNDSVDNVLLVIHFFVNSSLKNHIELLIEFAKARAEQCTQ